MLIPKHERSADLPNELRLLVHCESDLEVAALRLKEFLITHPKDTEALLWLNMAYLKQARSLVTSPDNVMSLVEAENLTHEILKTEPANYNALILLTRLFRDTGRKKETLELWQTPITNYPEDADYKLGYAWALAYNNNKEEAQQWLKDATKIADEEQLKNIQNAQQEIETFDANYLPPSVAN
jgi:tetratricopeptide (TPR) repeat protein